MTATSPASMGGPLSEAERIAEIQARVEAYRDTEGLLVGSLPVPEFAIAEVELKGRAPADLAFLLNLVGVLEGQLATAREELAEQRYYGEQLQMSIESCSGNHDDALGLDGGAPDAE